MRKHNEDALSGGDDLAEFRGLSGRDGVWWGESGKAGERFWRDLCTLSYESWEQLQV